MPTLAQSYILTSKGPYMRPVIIDNTQNSVTYAVVNVASGDSMVINWKVQAKTGWGW